MINSLSLHDVLQITPIVLEAVGHLKGEKSDYSHDFSSDCLKNAPMILFEQLATYLESLTHEYSDAGSTDTTNQG